MIMNDLSLPHDTMSQNPLLTTVPQEHYFHAANGTIIRGILELDQALEHMSEETFSYHVNSTKNDFANWIRNIIKDEALAAKIGNTDNKQAMQIIVLRRVIEIFQQSS